jgi:hypothetical protein
LPELREEMGVVEQRGRGREGVEGVGRDLRVGFGLAEEQRTRGSAGWRDPIAKVFGGGRG